MTTPSQAALEDPEDALMQVMMGGGSDAKAPQNDNQQKQKAVKLPEPHVLAQTSQAIQQKRVAPTSVATRTSKVEPAPDSEAGVMQSFVQEVSDLAQGEPGNGQPDPAEPVKLQQQQQNQESEAHMMSSFVQEVSRLAQGEPAAAENQPASVPATASGLALSSDLAGLMGLSEGEQPSSFLQTASTKKRTRAFSRSELAAAALLKDLESSEVSKRLARAVAKLTVEANIAMLTSLREQLQGHQLKWTCSKGPAAAHSLAVLQMAEIGTSLLFAEHATVESLEAELRDAQATSAELRSDLVASLDANIGHSYTEAGSELQTLPLAYIRNASPTAASAISAFENMLQADAATSKSLASKMVNSGSEYVRLADTLHQTITAKDSELQKAQRVLSDARTRAAAVRTLASKEPGCADAARTSGLIAAVYRALDVLKDGELDVV
jgi:hypothetical protein